MSRINNMEDPQEDIFREELLSTEQCFDIVEETLREHNFQQIADKVRYNRYDNGPYRILRQVSIEFYNDDHEKLIDFYLRINPYEPHFEDIIIYLLVQFLATLFGTYLATKLALKENKQENTESKRQKLSDCCIYALRGYMLREMLYERRIKFSEFEDLMEKIRSGNLNHCYNLVEKYEVTFLEEHDLESFEEIIEIITYKHKNSKR